MTEVCEAERNWRVQTLRLLFVFFVVLLFLFSSRNDEISLSSNCISSFDLSNQLGSIFASHSDSSSSEKYFKLSANFSFSSLCGLREKLSNRSSGVQMPCDICTRFGRYLCSTKCSCIIKIDILNMAYDWRG